MYKYEDVIAFIKKASEGELMLLNRSSIFALLTCLKYEIDRRQAPKKRGKFRPISRTLPIPRELENAVRRINKVWAAKLDGAKK